ncbi:hypothetical protein Taro_014709, partial [Colocasia esculenta]|nr:hypothetical protein [Colocasia esculenta]
IYKALLEVLQLPVDNRPKAVDRRMPSRTPDPLLLSTGTHRARKPELCLLLAVDSPFLAVDRYHTDLDFCTLSCSNPCQNFILKAKEVTLSFTLIFTVTLLQSSSTLST